MKRSKLILSITTLILTIACLTFGVYSATRTNFTASGTITFNSYNVDCDLDIIITGLDKNAEGVTQDSATKLYSKTLYASTTGTRGGNYTTVVNSTTSLSLGNLKFDELNTDLTDEQRSTITISITLYNYSKYDVQLSVTKKSADITGLSVTYGAMAKAPKSENGTDKTTSTTYYTMILNATDKIESGTFSPEITIQPYTEDMSLLKYQAVDTDAGISSAYWYVEMGHLDDEAKTPVRWRLISQDGKLSYTATTEDNKPTTLKGTYILESWNDTVFKQDKNFRQVCFDRGGASDKGTCSNDYATSEVRDYLNGKNMSSVSNGKAYYYSKVNSAYTEISDITTTNFMSDMNISSTDTIYNLIQRVDFGNKGYAKSLDTTNTLDAFYLLSKEEALKLLCGGDQWDNDKARWRTDSGFSEYWLRSYKNTLVEGVGSKGTFHDGIGSYTMRGVRSAFQIS